MKCRVGILSVLLLGLIGCAQTQMRGQAPDEIAGDDAELKAIKLVGDVTDVVNPAPTPISGVALVYNLEGTGGGIPPGEFKKMLEDQLRKQGVGNVSELMSSPNCTMVTVNVMIPPGIRKGDLLDVEVMLQAQSRAASLAYGTMYDCWLYDYETSKTKQGGDRMLKGHILAKARGPLLVGLNDNDEEQRFRRGRIWEGAVSLIDAPFYLYLKNDQKFAAVANTVANRINSAFPDDAKKQQHVQQTKRWRVLDEVTGGINEKYHGASGTARGDAAQAVGKGELIRVNVPFEYHSNPARYLLVVRLIPLRETADAMAKYRKRLGEMLLDPQETIRAALRLEALGKPSLPALKKGLASDCVLVRFASAEALAYLGSTAGVEELGTLAQKHETLREACLTALGSLSESASRSKLAQLLESPIAEVRMGAFRDLLSLTEYTDKRSQGPVQGELLNEAFWLHQVAPTSEPMVHLASSRRAEVVVFGSAPALRPPFRLGAGSAFSVIAEPGDTRCTVTHYKVNAGTQQFKQCSLQVADIVQTMAALGGQYPDAFDLLRQADREKCLNCTLRIDALPTATPIELLAACGANAAKFKNDPARQQEVLAAQEDLGMVVGVRVGSPKR